jgi:O-antigen ligase
MAISPNYAPPVPQIGRSPVADPEAGAFLKVGFGLLLLDTFLNVSRSLEILTLHSGITLPYVATGIHALAFILAFVTGGARRLATNRTGIFLMLFTGWMLACTPFSFWRGGSVQTILYQWMPSLVGFLAIGLLCSVRQCRMFASVLAFSTLTIALASFFLGTNQEGRFAFASGTLGNANDLAMLLLLGAPFFLVPLLDSTDKRMIKYLALPAGLVVIAANFRTGSRAGLLALITMTIVLFFTRSLMGKLKLAGALIALAAVLVVFIPSYSLYRYTTILNESTSAAEANSETYGSSALRRELLYESLMTTLEHPVFGLGPGVFAPAMAKEAALQGKFANWKATHNTYTQVSSEMGIPGLLVYLAAIFCAFLDLLWVRRHSREDASCNALALGALLSMAGLSVSCFFGSNAYAAWVPILLGLSAMLRLNRQRDLEQKMNVRVAPASAQQAPKPMPARPVTQPAQAPAYAYRFLGRPRPVRARKG